MARYGGVPPYPETQNYLALVGRARDDARRRGAPVADSQAAGSSQQTVGESRSRCRTTFAKSWNRTAGSGTSPNKNMGRTTIVALLLLAAGTSFGQGSRGVPLRVTAVRHWSLDAVTRIAVEVSGDFEYHTERLHNPERVFFDIFRARPAFDGKRSLQEGVGDKLVSKVRIAETLPGVTRVVLDLASPVVYTASTMANPSRLVIELRPAEVEAPAPTVESAVAPPPVPAHKALETRPAAPVLEPPPPAAVPPASPIVIPEPSMKTAPPLKAAAPPAPTEAGTAANRNSDGKNSLIRALGLKISRVVIDPGHGGHDQGTVGKRGLMEKELVLDVGRRLGRLIEQQIGCEVVYTRSDDTFVPLEGRTALANEKQRGPVHLAARQLLALPAHRRGRDVLPELHHRARRTGCRRARERQLPEVHFGIAGLVAEDRPPGEDR